MISSLNTKLVHFDSSDFPINKPVSVLLVDETNSAINIKFSTINPHNHHLKL